MAGAGDAAASRRGNGLAAPAWSALADLDPRVADVVLARLSTHGIAAYAVPAQGHDPVTYAALPPRLRDRVFVDATAVDAARAVIADELPEDAVDEETAWREIVATLRRDDGAGLAPWPSAEDVTRPRHLARRAEPPPAPPVEGELVGADLEPIEHFEPPPPPPLPVVSTRSAYGIAAILGGLIVLIVPTMAGDPVGPELLVLAVAAIIGGFVVLLSRMREGPPTDSGPDDGAVV